MTTTAASDRGGGDPTDDSKYLASLPGGVSDPPFPDPDDRLILEPACARCPEPAAARECVSWGVGPADASVFVVGEAPGRGDPDAALWRGGNWTGMAFTTRHSGRRIRSLLANADLLEESYCTNAVKCLPPDGDGGTRPPTDEERATCRGHLERELEIVEPDVVVPAGRAATASVFAAGGREVESFLDTVLEVHRLPDLPPVVPILHPSYRDVWASRLGYEDGPAYERAVADGLHAVIGDGA